MMVSFWHIRWPRFSLYPPLMMGIIQPEWLYLYQLMSDSQAERIRQTRACNEFTPSSTVNTPIRIRFHARPESGDKKRSPMMIRAY
ncbi:hypothetical protein [Desmospora profundinema]|uniref:Secreted protein n=1 Tax=Desmospora profundinema TaxID=1571184 RepID=A0ABU1IP12_9BACL|nr:hypothetical protein [Desmospora profundinema]MDR6226517.1 hypothetical protein [Desmospora profundinema]